MQQNSQKEHVLYDLQHHQSGIEAIWIHPGDHNSLSFVLPIPARITEGVARELSYSYMNERRGRSQQRYQFVVVGFVVMPEHFHLLISEPEKGNPSVVIQALKLTFLKRLFPTSLKKREESGTLQLLMVHSPDT